MTYPIPFRVNSYRPGTMGAFGALRSSGREHGACDLYAQPETVIFACEPGLVTLGPYLFYDGSFAIEVTLADGIAIVEAERDEARAHVAFLQAQLAKAKAASEFEVAKRKLPGYYEGALIGKDFAIAPKESKQ